MSKLVNQDLDAAKSITKKPAKSRQMKLKARIEAALKQSKYALLKSEEDLTENQKRN